jgi:prepilin-type N-terminal cleavage/methylation domain-containing protein
VQAVPPIAIYSNGNKLACRVAGGFSLVEMAIVLVIIGLIVAVISGGQHLIKNAEVKGIIIEIGNYTEAFNNFEDKYQNLPGDLTEDMAGRFFTGAATHSNDTDKGNSKWDDFAERNLAWAQISQSGMVNFNYVADSDAVVGVNRPESLIDGAGWDIDEQETLPKSGVDIGKHFIIASNGAANDFLDGEKLSIDHHIMVDAKIDKPNSPLEGYYVVLTGDCVNDAGSGNYFYEESAGSCVGAYLFKTTE